MLNLASALQTARLSLQNATAESAIISRNISSAGQTGYARRAAEYIGQEVGAGAVLTVRRIAEDSLRAAALDAGASASGAQTRQSALDRLDAIAGTRNATATLSDLLGALKDALSTYAGAPNNATMGAAAVTAAGDVAKKLNALSNAAQTMRDDADKGVADAVAHVNDLLAQFKPANDAVVSALATGADASDAQDKRDAILADLSQELAITVRPQRDGGLAIYADGGLTLFEKEPRTVSFTPTTALPSGASGGAVMIDGVDATSPGSMMKLGSGRIASLIALRDETGVALQSQFDETANALVDVFSENGAQGLFVAAAGTSGTANRIAVAAAVDPAQGGDVSRLRDGAVAGVSMNPSGASGYADRLNALVAAFGQTRAFTATSGLAQAASLEDFATQGVGWIAAQRQDAASAVTQETAVRDSTLAALANKSGVSVDDEMARLLDVERSYQASAKILTAIDSMFNSFMQAVQ